MFVVSVCEQNNQYNLHRKSGKVFESYTAVKDVAGQVTSMQPAPVDKQVIIFGYHAKANFEVVSKYNIYFGEGYAITEIPNDDYEHMMAEWANSDVLLKNGFIFGVENQVEAVAKAKDTVFKQLDTGTRPMILSEKYKNNFGATTANPTGIIY